MKVLNFGSLNMDYVYKLHHIVENGETISSDTLHIYPGGKGLNQSVALAGAGIKVWHGGAVGEDGMFLVDFLNCVHVNTNHIKVLPDRKTGHAVIQNDWEGENGIILFGGANQAVTRTLADEILEDFETGDYLILQNEISELDYIVRKAHEKGMILVLNPSPMNEDIYKLPLEYIDYFILNEIEALQILNNTCGGQIQDKQTAHIMKRLSMELCHARILLTLGSEGSVYMHGSKTIRQKSYKVKAVDTTAAGDTFAGYFIAGVIQKRSVEDAMDTAARAAAVTVSRAGAGISIPVMEDVVRIMGEY